MPSAHFQNLEIYPKKSNFWGVFDCCASHLPDPGEAFYFLVLPFTSIAKLGLSESWPAP